MERLALKEGNPTQFDLLETAILTTSGSPEFEVEETGGLLARVQGLRETLSRQAQSLPQTDFTAKDWREVVSLYINHGLAPDDPSTFKLLRYFEKQRTRAELEESKQSPVLGGELTTFARRKVRIHQDSLDGALVASGLAAVLGFTFASTVDERLNREVDQNYPMYSREAIRSYDKSVSIIDTPENADLLKRAEQRRNEIKLIDQQRESIKAEKRFNLQYLLGYAITLTVGGLGALGTLALGGLKTYTSIFRPELQTKPIRLQKPTK